MPDLRDLSLFVAVVDAGSITAGASVLDLSLATASERIKALEVEHGRPLLVRGRRGVTPTSDGEALLVHARRVLGAHHDLERSMRARRLGLHHEVRIEANSSAVDALTEVLAAALSATRDTSVVLHEARSVDALAHVAQGSADLAVVSDAPGRGALQARPLWPDPLVVVGMGAASGSGPVDLSEVMSRPMIGLVEGTPLQVLVEEEGRRRGLAPSYRVRLPSLPSVCAVASIGAGAAVVPAATARRQGLPRGAVVQLAGEWARRSALLVARDFEALAPPVAALAALLVQHRGERW